MFRAKQRGTPMLKLYQKDLHPARTRVLAQSCNLRQR